MESKEREIIYTAIEMFSKYGLKPVTMDDLALELSISKKTLYKYFTNKKELVEHSVKEAFASVSQLMQQAKQHSNDAIEELFNLDKAVCHAVETHDHSLQFQLKRYYPETYAWLEKQRKEKIVKQMQDNLKAGVKQGLYRSNLNLEVISLLYYTRMVVLMGEEMEPFKGFDTQAVMREILIYHLRGIASPKGVERLEKLLKQNTENDQN
jgi:AcrR family transcriptional regulator